MAAAVAAAEDHYQDYMRLSVRTVVGETLTFTEVPRNASVQELLEMARGAEEEFDFADSWAGESHVSTCTMARITELGNLSANHVAHIGARNSFNPKDHIDLANERNIRFNPMFEVLERGVDTVIDEYRIIEGNHPIFTSPTPEIRV